jgi:hypothetical protein
MRMLDLAKERASNRIDPGLADSASAASAHENKGSNANRSNYYA